MAKLAVVGAGMMGRALCVSLADRGHAVRLIGTPLDAASVRALRDSRRHPRLDLELSDVVRGYPSAEFEDVDVFVLGVSSAGVGLAMPLAEFFPA